VVGRGRTVAAVAAVVAEVVEAAMAKCFQLHKALKGVKTRGTSLW